MQGLRELEFDREMGKLSEADYAALHEGLMARALDASAALERSQHRPPHARRRTAAGRPRLVKSGVRQRPTLRHRHREHQVLPAMRRRSRGGKILQRMRRAAFRIGARRGAGRAMTAALIEARALGKSFGPTLVLRDVSLIVEAGRGQRWSAPTAQGNRLSSGCSPDSRRRVSAPRCCSVSRRAASSRAARAASAC